jgi:hypothetical protein
MEGRGGDGGGLPMPMPMPVDMRDLPPEMAELAQLLARPPAPATEEVLVRQQVAARMVAALQDAEAARATATPASRSTLARQARRPPRPNPNPHPQPPLSRCASRE